MKISGIIPLRNAVKLGYPFELAIRSLRMLCDEVVILVDPTSEDDTLARVKRLAPMPRLGQPSATVSKYEIIASRWDMANHNGHTNCEISVQTEKACAAATGDWILSLQADEVLHEDEFQHLRTAIEIANRRGVTAIELERLYFYGDLQHIRNDWTLWMVRLFKRGHWKPDVDGAMRFTPSGPHEIKMRTDAVKIYHYSRIGDPALIAERVRNLDRFFHRPEDVQAGALPAYDFSRLRKLDTYVLGSKCETDPNAQLVDFPLSGHPTMAREYFGVKL